MPIVNVIRLASDAESGYRMCDAGKLLWSLFLWLFRSRASLEAEDLVLRLQLMVLRRTAPKRLRFDGFDRLFLVGLYRVFPDLRDALAVVRPEPAKALQIKAACTPLSANESSPEKQGLR